MNPFIQIVPREEEDLINEEFVKRAAKEIKETIKSKRLIIFTGEPGLGKTHYLKRVHKRLKSKKDFLLFDEMLAKRLNNYVRVGNKTLFIDNLDLSEGLNDEYLFKLLDEMSELLEGKVIMVTALTERNYKRFLRINPLLRVKTKRIKLPRLTHDEAVKLIIKRLNEARMNKSDDVSPFTKQELREIISKCNGNPRMILMLLGRIYELRVLNYAPKPEMIEL